MQSDHMRSRGPRLVEATFSCATQLATPQSPPRCETCFDQGWRYFCKQSLDLFNFQVKFPSFRCPCHTTPHQTAYNSAAMRSTWKSSTWIQRTAWWRNSRRAKSTSSETAILVLHFEDCCDFCDYCFMWWFRMVYGYHTSKSSELIPKLPDRQCITYLANMANLVSENQQFHAIISFRFALVLLHP